VIARAIEHALVRALAAWRALSLDAKVVGTMAFGNWLLLFANHTTVAATRDDVLWRLFPPPAGLLWLAVCGILAATYAMRDLRGGFTARDRWLHLAAIVAAFVVLPTVASIVLRETGKPYTYVHDGAIMIEEAARKLVRGHNPYTADYLDTPLFFWPMVNNPALYHLTYFPFLFLLTVPFTTLFDALGVFWDQRYMYLPAYLATLAVVPLLVRGVAARLALVAAIALNPQLFPFVVEGRNDFFVLVWLFAGVVLLQRGHDTLGTLLIALAAAAKLHAAFLLPFVFAYLVATKRARVTTFAPAAIALAALFVPFLANDFAAFYDDIVRYNGGGAAWSYPISGMGFSAILLAIGIIPSRQADFPFAAFQLATAVPIAWWSLRRLVREPTIADMLVGYALTLLAFLFFGRYFQGNYAGYIAAVATPALLMGAAERPAARRS